VAFAAPGGRHPGLSASISGGMEAHHEHPPDAQEHARRHGLVLNSLLNYDLIQTTDAYLEKNRDTVFRFCGAIYRTLDYPSRQ
jgi:hypothetical protein